MSPEREMTLCPTSTMITPSTPRRGSASGAKVVLAEHRRRRSAGRLIVFMENVRIKIHAVRPPDGSGDLIHGCQAERPNVLQRFKDTPVEHAVEVKLPDELEALSLAAAEHAERWAVKP
jgi:hypothetical protein